MQEAWAPQAQPKKAWTPKAEPKKEQLGKLANLAQKAKRLGVLAEQPEGLGSQVLLPGWKLHLAASTAQVERNFPNIMANPAELESGCAHGSSFR